MEHGVYFVQAVNAAVCSLLSSYTLISILDHERWMKEWGDDHEPEAVMHLRTPILSAAMAMGLGGITTVHQVNLSSIQLDGEAVVGGNILYSCLAAVTGITTMFAMLYVARMDAFAGVDRVERLKEIILKRHTISELKLKKGLGKRVAYMGKMHHIVAAGTILATGIMGCWSLNVLGLSGVFVVVVSTSGIAYLAVYVLLTSILSCWLLFRVLVWKPSYEYLRPLCAASFALALWSVDHIDKTGGAIAFDYREDGGTRSSYGWSYAASRGAGELLMLLTVFGAVVTQYAIALELRLAYCGLQDTNLDLQLLAGTGAPAEHIRKSSALRNTSKRRHTGGARGASARSVPTRSRRRSVVVHAAASCPGSPASPLGSPMSPGSPSSSTMNLSSRTFGASASLGAAHGAHMTTSASVLGAVLRMGSKMREGVIGKSDSQPRRSVIRVQQAAAAKEPPQVVVYEPSVAEHPDEDTHDQHLPLPLVRNLLPLSVAPLTARDKTPSFSGEGWEVVRPSSQGKGRPVYEAPPKKFDVPDSAV